jgi:Uma2 family endonuclease
MDHQRTGKMTHLLVQQASMRHARLLPQRRAEQIMAMPLHVPANIRVPDRRWTSEEVRRLIAESPLATPRYELVGGELLVTPSPSGSHQRAVALLLNELLQYLRRAPMGHAYTSPFDVELEKDSIVQPDVFVVPPHEAKRLVTEMPARELLLAAEVISPSSGHHDRVKKRPHYQARVPEYWIVDLDARLFERWRTGDERPEILVAQLEWLPTGAAEPFRLELPAYFAEVFLER